MAPWKLAMDAFDVTFARLRLWTDQSAQQQVEALNEIIRVCELSASAESRHMFIRHVGFTAHREFGTQVSDRLVDPGPPGVHFERGPQPFLYRASVPGAARVGSFYCTLAQRDNLACAHDSTPGPALFSAWPHPRPSPSRGSATFGAMCRKEEADQDSTWGPLGPGTSVKRPHSGRNASNGGARFYTIKQDVNDALGQCTRHFELRMTVAPPREGEETEEGLLVITFQTWEGVPADGLLLQFHYDYESGLWHPTPVPVGFRAPPGGGLAAATAGEEAAGVPTAAAATPPRSGQPPRVVGAESSSSVSSTFQKETARVLISGKGHAIPKHPVANPLRSFACAIYPVRHIHA